MSLLQRVLDNRLGSHVYARTPTRLRNAVMKPLHLAAAVARKPIVLRRYDLPVDGDKPARIVVADHGRGYAELLQEHWPRISESEATLGRVVWPRLPAVLDALAAEVDLVIARFHAGLGRRWLGRRYVAVPESVSSRADVPADGSLPPQARRGQHGNLRALRKAGLRWEVSHRFEDFDRFYHEMYLPFVRARFGAFADATTWGYLRSGFMLGGLMWIIDGDMLIAGTIYSVEDGVLYSWVGGTAGGDVELLKRGVAPAMDVFSFELAHHLGAASYDMAMSRPVLNDGVLLYKKRWGAGLRGGQITHCNFYLRWDRPSTRLSRVLASLPVAVHDGGRLSGVVVCDRPAEAEEVERLATTYAMQGLRRLYVMAPNVERVQRAALTDGRVRDLDVRLLPAMDSTRLGAVMRECDASRERGGAVAAPALEEAGR